jgi:hypothetical protein
MIVVRKTRSIVIAVVDVVVMTMLVYKKAEKYWRLTASQKVGANFNEQE